MNATLLRELKEVLARDEDPAPVSLRFFESVEADRCTREGEPHQSDLLEETLAELGKEFLGQDRIERVALRRVARERFVHGVVWVAGRPGALLYFEDIRVGVVSLVLDRIVQVVRFHTWPDPDHSLARCP